jgi:DNA processing protein
MSAARIPEHLPHDACAAALCSLPGMTPARLRLLLARHSPPAALAVACGQHDDPVFVAQLRTRSRAAHDDVDLRHRWEGHLVAHPPERWLEVLNDTGVAAVLRGAPGYPECLHDDPDAPAVLFCRGDLGVLHGRRAAVVGTRSATASGLRFAHDLGRALAEHDVRVVSGLARGIDGAAHRGALAAQGEPAAPPIAVVASGPDVIYPREHADLWERIAACGLLVSEHPPGTSPSAYAFPERNRILAALAEVVVVVESCATGGSLIKARHAAQRDIGVMAVPGSLSSRASEGTNRLLRDGVAAMVLDVTDVLVGLGLDSRRAENRRFDPRPLPEPDERRLLDLIGADALTIDELVLRTGDGVVDVAVRLGRLERSGWVLRSGGWFVVRQEFGEVNR